MEEKYGEVEEMNICDNLGDHLVGNVYVKVCVASRNLHKWCMIFFFCQLYTVCLLMFLCSSVTKKMLRRLWLIWTIDGLMGSPSMLSSLRSQTFEKRAAGNMRWGECFVMAPSLRNWWYLLGPNKINSLYMDIMCSLCNFCKQNLKSLPCNPLVA